jgi:hypothetical protein
MERRTLTINAGIEGFVIKLPVIRPQLELDCVYGESDCATTDF